MFRGRFPSGGLVTNSVRAISNLCRVQTGPDFVVLLSPATAPGVNGSSIEGVSYRAGSLHPRLSVNLHGKRFTRPEKERRVSAMRDGVERECGVGMTTDLMVTEEHWARRLPALFRPV